jgi:hypothetical protein
MSKTPKPGQPGNPGRPKGARGKRNQLLEPYRPELVEKLVKLALQGDPTAMRLCIERLIPRFRAVAVPVKVNSDSEDLSVQGRELIRSAFAGEITPDALKDLFTALYAQGRLAELSELETRLAALENQQGAPPWEQEQPERDRLPTGANDGGSKNESGYPEAIGIDRIKVHRLD